MHLENLEKLLRGYGFGRKDIPIEKIIEKCVSFDDPITACSKLSTQKVVELSTAIVKDLMNEKKVRIILEEVQDKMNNNGYY